MKRSPRFSLRGLGAAGLALLLPASGVVAETARVAPRNRLRLSPVDVGEFFVAPGKRATLRWHVDEPGSAASLAYVVKDYAGRPVNRGMGTVSPDGTLTVTRTFSRGFCEIDFTSADQAFGVISLEPHAGKADPFFGMDSALSALESNPATRASLIRALSRSGVAMARERLGLNLAAATQSGFDWEGGQRLDATRKIYAENGVPVLEILDGDLAELPRLASGFGEAARRWKIWGGAEAGNEPDLRATPADQYAPLGKTLSYALRQAHSPAPLVAGVFATIPPGPFFDACANNGMLEDCDAVSFHSYDRAGDVEGTVSCYREWLKKEGKEGMPLWHTECGWAWASGPARPPQDQDATSALEISAKAVESMACGVGRYFPFVYVSYEEGRKNFGMMGREATPLRGMAAYAACVDALSGKSYLGDVPGLGGAVKQARVFGRPSDAECVAVVYTGTPSPNATVPFPMKVRRVTGADGRALAFGKGVPVPDGLAYVWVSRASLAGKLAMKTRAMRLYQIGRYPVTTGRRASPLVMRFLPSQTPSRASARGYLVTPEAARSLPLNARIDNLSASPIVFTPELSLPGKAAQEGPPVTVPARGHRDVAWRIDVSSGLDIAQTRFLIFSGRSESGAQPLPLAVPLVMEGTLEQHLRRHERRLALPIAELGRWSENVAGGGRSVFSATPEGSWRMGVTFTEDSAKWAYPKFALPERIDPKVYSGFVLRARVLRDAGGVAVIAESDGGPSFWVNDLFPPDGAWHTVYVPFDEFKVGPGGTGDQNTRRDPAAWRRISLGMGSHAAENSFEVSDLLLVGGGGG